MKKIEKDDVINLLKQIVKILEIKGENVFKVRAYENAVRIFENYEGDLISAIKDKSISKIKGIGEAITSKLYEFVTTGKLEYYEKIRKDVPQGLLELLNIQGLGGKRIKILREKLDIKNIEDLSLAIEKGEVAKLTGFGPALQESIKKSLEIYRGYKRHYLFAEAEHVANQLIDNLRSRFPESEFMVCGSIRRKKEIVKDIDILSEEYNGNGKEVMDYFCGMEGVVKVIAQGKTKSSIVSDKGINVDIRVIVKDEFPSAINYFTGSKEHNIRLRQIAKEKGYKLNEYGLWKNENRIKLRDEKELYKYLGMKYIEPEMREDMGEIELAISEKLPELVGISDVKGVVHVHTNYSDGKNSIEENIRFAKEKGYEYIVISDHSKAAYYANGVDEERIRKQWKEIDELNRMVKGIKIYKGIECDIMQDGSPDIDVSVLKDMDVVIGAIHSNLGMSEEAATKRMLSAINTGIFDIIAHPTGRLLQRREGYKLDHEKFRQTVTERGIVIEINSQPERLDYDWREVIKGKREGCKFVISVDAHAVNQIDYLRYGVGIARKGWLERNDVINCMSVNEFDKLIRKFKERRNNGR